MTIDSHHCIQHKSAAFNSIVNRLFIIPMIAENKLKELKRIKRIAKTNGFSEEFVDKIHKKHKP
jgi:predicted oxidoreductase (fatty acid repression mutant protein)